MMERSISILLVEDDHDFRDSCARWMQRKGHHVVAAASGAEALAICQRHDFDVGVFDMNMPGMSGIELLQRIRDDSIDLEVVILTGQGTIESAVQAMKMGASDYLTKPCPLGDLEHHCELARERSMLRRENKQLKAILSRTQTTAKLVGDSDAMQRVGKWIERIAPTDKPVLISGESGTGKEVVAKAIWRASHLADQPFVTINCAALPETLVESELFGHQKGAFTGATSEKPGLFEVANGGTLLIDELGEMPLSLQPKLLRVLEDGSMRRIGSHKERKVNVRIIAATNRDLSDDVKKGTFREDLFYRVNVLPVHLPPLRERRSDVDQLIDYFLPVEWSIDAAARQAMNEHSWPGNVRELINVIQRATILADNDEITLDDLPRELLHHEGKTHPTDLPHRLSASGGTSDCLDDVAKAHILYILERENGNKAKSARVLGIHRRKLYRLLERFHVLHGADSQQTHGESVPVSAEILD
nr:sigma-54 dependent transcriptional regulator [Novipirellula artificiosorum]